MKTKETRFGNVPPPPIKQPEKRLPLPKNPIAPPPIKISKNK